MIFLSGLKENNFEKGSSIAKLAPNTIYTIKMRGKDYSILSYGNNINTIKVLNALIPFWAKNEEKLYYKNGIFNRNII